MSPLEPTSKSPSTSLANPVTRQDYRFFHRLRVRWAEVDMQKIVFNAHYLMYLDTAMTDYWRAVKLPYEAAMHQLGGEMFVKKATVEYHASARCDDALDVGLRCARIGNSSVDFTGHIYRGDTLVVSAQLLYVFADPVTQKSKPVPPALREIFMGFEAGETMTTLQLGDWATLETGARPVRTEVFLKEQGIPLDMEWDAADHTAVHAVATNRLGMAVGTGRLLERSDKEPGIARIGRMAVNRNLRGTSLGRDLLAALMDVARRRGDQEVRLHAQRSAEAFYARLGFKPIGEPFVEAGIPHIEMGKSL